MGYAKGLLSAVRPFNLVMLMGAQVLAVLLLSVGDSDLQPDLFPSGWLWLLMIISTALIGAGGNLYNDAADREADRINRPERFLSGRAVPENILQRAAWCCFIAGWLVAATLLSFPVELSALWIPFLAVPALCLYSLRWQHLPLLGNALIAVLAAASIALPAGLIPAAGGVPVVLFFAALAGTSTWIREWVKDLEDIPGDRAIGSGTAAVRWSLGQNRIGISITLVIQLLLVLWGILRMPFPGPVDRVLWNAWGALILLSYAAFVLFLFRASDARMFHHLSLGSKGLMLAGMVWMLFLLLSTQ